MTLTEDELEDAIARGAERGATTAMTGLLEKFGIDVQNVKGMQADFIFLRTKRENAEKIRNAGPIALVTSIVAAAVTGFVTWLTTLHAGPPHAP